MLVLVVAACQAYGLLHMGSLPTRWRKYDRHELVAVNRLDKITISERAGTKVCALALLLLVQAAPADDAIAIEFPNICSFLTNVPAADKPALAKVRGIVTYQHEGRSIFIQDASGGLYAGSETVQPLQLGDDVEITGSVNRSGFSPTLTRCAFKKLGPVKMPFVQAANVKDAAAGKYDMRLIRLTGEFVAWREKANTVFLMIVSDKIPFEAQLVKNRPGDPFPLLRLGSIVEVTGACAIQSQKPGKIQSMQLLLRAPSDLTILSPPRWWTPVHVRNGTIVMGTLAVLALAYIAALKYQVRRQTAEIVRINRDLEQKVQQRTLELEATNRELEAFSYSVSHDLKGPLRAIEGFSKLLREDHGAELSGDGPVLLERIQESALNMFNLITGLLGFSRLTQSALRAEKLDMTELAKTSFQELALEREGRNVEFTVEELPKALGDKALITQVWVNLLSNAIKYARTRDPAKIKVGAIAGVHESTYSISDNGIGFDMRGAGGLFRVFNRLHRDKDYEGSGVGLAIAQRIISRHQGRIWAEAEPCKGATFYFTLPVAPKT